jgi:hypothetical protein
MVTPVAAVQGVSFTEEQARATAVFLTQREHQQTINAWTKYGVSIEADVSNCWHWAETNDEGEANGPYSPYFETLERCLEDLVLCFGTLESQT